MSGPARYIFPTAWNGWPPGPGGDVGRPDLRVGRAARGEHCSSTPRLLRGGGDRGLGAVGDPAQVAGEPGRHPEGEVAEELVAVVAVELEVEVAEGPAIGFEVPATRRGLKGRT